MDAQDPVDPPIAPPTFAGPVPVEPPRSKWPTVLGIIAIILAGIGLLSIVGQFIAQQIPQPSTAATQPAYPEPPAGVQAIMTPSWLVVSALLLVGGIGLLNRRRWSVRALIVWAIGDVVFTLAGTVGTLINLPTFQQQMRQQNAGMPPGAGGMFEAIFIGAMCFGSVVGFAPPIFALVWFRRRKIKDEVAGWR
jgi:hypothetical protein